MGPAGRTRLFRREGRRRGQQGKRVSAEAEEACPLNDSAHVRRACGTQPASSLPEPPSKAHEACGQSNGTRERHREDTNRREEEITPQRHRQQTQSSGIFPTVRPPQPTTTACLRAGSGQEVKARGRGVCFGGLLGVSLASEPT